MRIGEESLPPRFGISELPPDSGAVTLDTCDDAIPYSVMEMRKTAETRDTGLMEKKNNRGTTGKVEEHFPRHVQGLGLRKNSRRMPKKLFGGPAEAKEPQKRHVQGSDGRNRYEGWLVGVRRGWRRKRVVGKWLTCPHAPARETQSPVGKTRMAGAWVVF